MKVRDLIVVGVILFAGSATLADYSPEKIMEVTKGLAVVNQPTTISEIETIIKNLLRTRQSLQAMAPMLAMSRRSEMDFNPRAADPSVRNYTVLKLAADHKILLEQEARLSTALNEARLKNPVLFNAARVRFNVIPGENRRINPRAGAALGIFAVVLGGVTYYMSMNADSDANQDHAEEALSGSDH